MNKSPLVLSIVACTLLISQPAYSHQRSVSFTSLTRFDYTRRELPEIQIEESIKEEPIKEEKTEEVLPAYRQTYYSVEEGELSVGALYSYNDEEMQIIDNVIHFNDSEYGYLPVIAINMNEVLASGQNSRGIWNVYGSVVELGYPTGETKNAIILDACGECSYASKIDLWVYENQERHDIDNVTLKYIRRGWS